jgi:hypothetical protein
VHGSFLAAPRRVVRYLVYTAALLTAVAVAGLCIQAVLAPRTPGAAAAPALRPGPSGATGVGKNGTAVAGPQQPLQLVAGTRYADGISTGYPHTLTGAVSAGVEYASVIGSTLAMGTASSLMQLIADPSYRNAAAQGAQGAQADRQQMGLPVSGPPPAGASISFSPSEYQIRDHSASQVTVLLLGDLTETTASGGTQVRLAVVPVPLRWAGSDWKVLAPDYSVDYSGLAATPGTQAAAGLGWQPIAF